MTKNNKKITPIIAVPSILDLIYPPKCGVCGKLCCDSLCKRCYNLFDKESIFMIEKNKKSEFFFNEHLYIFEYEGIIRKIILDYKFNDKAYLFETFVNFLLKNKKFFQIIKSYDTIIPVPISRERKNKRGYNQSALIAKKVADILNLEYNDDCLFKIKNIEEQSKLNKLDRLNNIKGVYKICNFNRLEGKKILLIDDVFTTGSTVNECCKKLIEANPSKIGILTIAKD